jgi:hypothetical protein
MTKAAEHDALEFPADTILPIQYFGMTGPQTFSCEQRLMLAVLVDAINVLGHSRIFPNGRHSGSFDEAFSWVFADGIASPLSFDRVCEALDVDPASLRSRLSGLLSNHSGALRRLRLKESSRFQTVTANRVRLRAESRRPPQNQGHDDARR